MITIKSNRLIGLGLGLLTASLTPNLAGAQDCGTCLPGQTTSTVVASGSYPAGAGFETDPLPNVQIQVPRFNPAAHGGAELKGVFVRLRGRHRSFGSVTNLNQTTDCTGTWTSRFEIIIQSDAALGLPDVGGGQALKVTSNRTEDFIDLPPQEMIEYGVLEQSGTDGFCVLTPAALDAWTGAGTVTIFGAGVSVIDNCNSPCGNLICIIRNEWRIEVDVIYTFCVGEAPDPQCPCVGPSPHYRRPGSLLLFPEFDNRPGSFTLGTVTNTKCDDEQGDVRIEFRFYDELQCQKQDFSRNLTACDTFSFIGSALNPQTRRGFFYVFAKDARDNPIVWNHLIGNVLILSALEEFDYSMNAVAFRGLGDVFGVEQPDGTVTDLNGNGHHDLDGREYEPAPDSITIPRFLGQDLPNSRGGPPALFRSQLILVALSGGRQFDTTVDFCVFNDNEEAFSEEWTFRCWDKPFLTDISALFTNSFLQSTEHAANEIFGASARESGWMIVHGAVANSSSTTIEKPSIYAVLVERVGNHAAADLPWECGRRFNGRLYPASLDGE